MARNGNIQASITVTFLVAFLTVGTCLTGQTNRYNQHWMFGNYAGVSFDNNNPNAFLGSAMASPEGVATISDQVSGALLLYSNGERIWGFNHLLIQGGDGLLGNANSTQSSLFVPYPKSTRWIYHFTTDAECGPNGIRYSLIDTDLGTNGAISGGIKNRSLRAPVTERMALLRHCHRQAYWVVAQQWNSNTFFAWLITEDGLDTSAVVSSTGPVTSGALENAKGYMRSSPNDDLIAIAVTGSNKVDMYAFDNLTGELTFLYTIDQIFQPYGVEFSMDQSMLYVSGLTGEIWQYNMQAPNIAATKTLVGSTNKLTGALQRAPDSRIYITRDLDHFLGYIASPNSPGSSCGYVQQGLYLSGRLSEAGLPPFIPVLEFHNLAHYTTCLGDSVTYHPTFLQRADSFMFYFGDPLALVYDSTDQVPASFAFPKTGNHVVLLKYYMCGEEFELKALVCVQSTPGVYLGEDTAICSNTTMNLQGILNNVYCPTLQNTFLWNTGQTSQNITISPPGTFSLTVTNLCGTGRDTVTIGALPVPHVTLGPDITLCDGDTVWLIPDPPSDSLVWNDGATDSIREVTQTGFFAITVVNEFNCSASDDVMITFLSPPEIGWELADTTICIGHPMELFAGTGFDSYTWHDGSTGTTFHVTGEGWYHVSVTNICGSDTDSMYVALEDCSLKLYVPNAFTPDHDGINDVFKAYGLYIPEFTMAVYTRWGEMIFYTKDIEQGWDGTYKDQPAQEGVYAWKIIYLDATNKYHQLTGTVTLVRR